MVHFIKKALRAVVQILRDFNEILEDYGEEKVKRLIYKEKMNFKMKNYYEFESFSQRRDINK